MAYQHKRRLIPIVDRRFQFKYTAIIVAVAALVSTVLGYFLLKSYLEMNEVIDLASLSPEVNDKLNSDDARFVFSLTLGFLVLEVVGLGIIGLLITHRVCGPVYVLHRHLVTLLEGRWPDPRPLRASDEFHGTFEIFTAVIDQLKKRDADDVDAIQKAVAKARAQGVSEADLSPLLQIVEERRTRIIAPPVA